MPKTFTIIDLPSKAASWIISILGERTAQKEWKNSRHKNQEHMLRNQELENLTATNQFSMLQNIKCYMWVLIKCLLSKISNISEQKMYTVQCKRSVHTYIHTTSTSTASTNQNIIILYSNRNTIIYIRTVEIYPSILRSSTGKDNIL